jgi:hypothetical protein
VATAFDLPPLAPHDGQRVEPAENAVDPGSALPESVGDGGLGRPAAALAAGVEGEDGEDGELVDPNVGVIGPVGAH